MRRWLRRNGKSAVPESTNEVLVGDGERAPARAPDPRETLASWANDQDEWLRFVARHVERSSQAILAKAFRGELVGARRCEMSDNALRTPLWDDNPSVVDLLGFDAVVAPIVDAIVSEDLDPLTIGVHAKWAAGNRLC